MVTHKSVIIKIILESWVAQAEGWGNNTKAVRSALFCHKHGQSFSQDNSCGLKWSWGLHALCVSSYAVVRGVHLLQGKSKHFLSLWPMPAPETWTHNTLGKRASSRIYEHPSALQLCDGLVHPMTKMALSRFQGRWLIRVYRQEICPIRAGSRFEAYPQLCYALVS